MKKLSLTLAALALVLGMSQCKKQEEPVQNGEKQHIVLNASFAESNSKIAEDGIGCLKWSVGDIIIVKQGETELGELECENAEDGTFEGDIQSATGNITFTFGEEKYMEQTGELNAAMHLTSPEVEYKADGNYGSVLMSISNAVLKLDVSALGTSGLLTIAAGGEIVASVTDVSGIASAVFVAVPTDETEKAYTITCNGKTATKTWTLEKNVFYTKAGAEGAGTGDAIVIKHEFSVGSGKTVEFAPGNLWYGKADGESTAAFHFEANQWSFAPASDGTWDPSHVSHFKWSDEANAVTDDFIYSGDLFCASNFTVAGDSHTWRTLTVAEWNYLLGFDPEQWAQTDDYGRPGAKGLCAWKEFDEGTHKGLVILPDGTDASVMESITSTEALAAHGAVFLPAAGGRLGTDVLRVGSVGGYWSGTPREDDEDRAYCMLFDSGYVYVHYGSRGGGLAVRLVR